MKAALYLRVSTTDQHKDGYSIPYQKDFLTKRAELSDWDIYDYYIDDESGKSTNRKDMQRMLTDARNRCFDLIFFVKLDRLTRSVKDLYDLWEEVSKYKIDLKSATEPIDTTTPIGQAIMGILAIFAQLERQMIAQRVSQGMEQMVKQGNWHGGPVPFGYRWDGVMTIVEEEAQLVREIYNLYVNGMGSDKITIRLNKQGGKKWLAKSVYKMLQNPIYIGQLHWNVRTDKDYFTAKSDIPPILSDELYEQAQAVRMGRRGIHPRSVNSQYIYSGRLRCGRCGSAMKGHTNTNKVRRYVCTMRSMKQCDLPFIREDIISRQFELLLDSWESGNSAITAAKEHAASIDTTKKERQTIERELEQIKKRRKKWLMDLGNEIITQEDFRDMTGEDRQREAELLEKLQEDEEISPLDTVELVKSLLVPWRLATDQEKKMLLQALTQSIIINKGETVTLDIVF
jgi:site-specific DNA recombinase